MPHFLVPFEGGVGPIQPSDLGFDPLSVAFWVGVIAPVIVALALHMGWSSRTKFWVAVAVMIVLTVFAWWTTSYPAQWQLLSAQFAVLFTASQLVFRALQPTGILQWLEGATTPGYEPKHAARD